MPDSFKFIACLLIISLYTLFPVMAQQWNQSSLTAVNPYREYAAYAGFDKSISIAAALRNQWVSLPGSPSFFYTGMHLPLYLYNVGTGIDLQGASDGVLKFRMARVSAGKALGVAGGTLSLAGRVGLTQITIDGNAIRTPEGDYTDGVIDHQDAALSNSSYAGTGLYWEGSVFFEMKDGRPDFPFLTGRRTMWTFKIRFLV
ncbi:MAG: type IX secretion system membrane protein PorP/SprF [Saprospiraceae bacterium]|nr:type IX secretion system membrane protein PorP/SprF [Saprospiraceae bacterium]